MPLLHQSINWFEGLIREQGIMSEVRSSELDIELSSSGEPAEGDIAVFIPQEVRAFMPSRRCVDWMPTL